MSMMMMMLLLKMNILVFLFHVGCFELVQGKRRSRSVGRLITERKRQKLLMNHRPPQNTRYLRGLLYLSDLHFDHAYFLLTL